MSKDPLGSLLKVRRRSVDQLRQHVAGCLEAERRLAGLVDAADDQLRRNKDALTTIPNWVAAADPFEKALSAVSERRQILAAELGQAASRTRVAQQALAGARLAVEAVETLIADRKEAERLLIGRKEQHVMDDLARTVRLRSRTG